MTATPPRPGAVASAKIVSRSVGAPVLPRIWSAPCEDRKRSGRKLEPTAPSGNAPSGSPMTANLLATETSPYLLQHRNNPVHWRAWGPEALAEAQRTNRLIIVSVGYAACHWCHVMAHERVEDADTAHLTNQLCVCGQ